MDKALELKIRIDRGDRIKFSEAKAYLNESYLFQKLLLPIEPKVLNLLWRLTQLSEIPFSHKFPQTQQWLDALIDICETDYGFSLNGKPDYMLSCYNAIITSLIIKLRPSEHNKIEKGIQWIMKYQTLERFEKTSWWGSGIKKYGGCMKQTPCYIGLVKSLIALSDYNHAGLKGIDQHELHRKMNQGLVYILNQKVYLRRSGTDPITKDITKLSYPFAYKMNMIEVLRLLKQNNLIDEPECFEAKKALLKKQKKSGFWYSQSVPILKNKTWVPFDRIQEDGYWITHEIKKLI